MSDLTTLAKVKEWLGESTNTNDSVLTRLISAASNYIETWLSRDILQASYTETRDGSGHSKMMLVNYPITSVSLVKIGKTIIPLSVDGSNGYVFNSTSVSLIGYVFERGVANVSLAYVAGYATVPPDIEQACIEMVSMRYKEKSRIGVTSKSMSGESITFSLLDMSVNTKAILSEYRRTFVP